MISSDLLSEYTSEIDDLSITLYIPNVESEMIESTHSSPFLHTHFYIEIFVCTSGELLLLFKDRTVKLAPGDVALIPSELSHSANTHDTKHFFTVGMLGKQRKEKGSRKTFRAFYDLLNIDQVRIFRGATGISEKLRELTNKQTVDRCFLPLRFASILSELSELSVSEETSSLLVTELLCDCSLLFPASPPFEPQANAKDNIQPSVNTANRIFFIFDLLIDKN